MSTCGVYDAACTRPCLCAGDCRWLAVNQHFSQGTSLGCARQKQGWRRREEERGKLERHPLLSNSKKELLLCACLVAYICACVCASVWSFFPLLLCSALTPTQLTIASATDCEHPTMFCHHHPSLLPLLTGAFRRKQLLRQCWSREVMAWNLNSLLFLCRRLVFKWWWNYCALASLKADSGHVCENRVWILNPLNGCVPQQLWLTFECRLRQEAHCRLLLCYRLENIIVLWSLHEIDKRHVFLLQHPHTALVICKSRHPASTTTDWIKMHDTTASKMFNPKRLARSPGADCSIEHNPAPLTCQQTGTWAKLTTFTRSFLSGWCMLKWSIFQRSLVSVGYLMLNATLALFLMCF